MQWIETGLIGRMEITVGREHLASTMGNTGAQVLSTHYVVLIMEQASRNAIQGRLAPGKITVGTGITVRHCAATPLGMKVTAEAVLKKVESRRLTFLVTVRDPFETLAEGENEQMIISVDKFLEKMKRKVNYRSL
jgi:fluoroacetyl-CoA thioesterase